ncbi:MAG TPA: hypothetical protein VJM53_10005, partial [Burkholderiales bacterium]|nr:hypothetical protein [Burkholderiales bacterium]
SGGALGASTPPGQTGHTGQAAAVVGHVAGVGVVQAVKPAINVISAVRVNIRADSKRKAFMDAGLLLLLAEAGLALALFIFIIWWTLPKKDKSDKQD